MKIDSKDSDKGFSLVELTVLLAITAVMAAFSIPVLNEAMHSMQLVGDVRGIASTMTCAKMNSGSEITHYRLTFTLGGIAWKLQKYNGVTFTDVSSHELSLGSQHSGIAFQTVSDTVPQSPAGYNASSSGIIEFNSRGIPVDASGAAQPAIIYISNNDENFAVSVSLSGKVQIWRNRNAQWTPE